MTFFSSELAPSLLLSCLSLVLRQADQGRSFVETDAKKKHGREATDHKNLTDTGLNWWGTSGGSPPAVLQSAAHFE